MKELIRQFYNEGFGNLFYKKPTNYLDKKVNNKTFVKILSFFLKIIYTILIIAFVIYYLYKKLPI